MGLNVGFNAITTGSLILTAILLVVTGILFVSAAENLKDIPEYDASSELQNAYNKLRTAYILIFVAAGVSLILALAYGGHEIWWSPSEWIHTVIFLVIVALLIIAVVYVYTVLNDIYTPRLQDRNGSDNFMWAGLWIALLAFIMLLATGSGRAGYNTVRSKVQDHFDNFKSKIEETHMHVTGQAHIEIDDGPEMVVSGPPPPSVVSRPPPQYMQRPPNGNCPGPVVVHAPRGPAPPSHTVTSLGPPVRTTYTTTTESQPVVETVRRTVSRTDVSPRKF